MKKEFVVTLSNKMEEVYLYDVFKVTSSWRGINTVLIGRIMVDGSSSTLSGKEDDFCGEIEKHKDEIFKQLKKYFNEDRMKFFQWQQNEKRPNGLFSVYL